MFDYFHIHSSWCEDLFFLLSHTVAALGSRGSAGGPRLAGLSRRPSAGPNTADLLRPLDAAAVAGFAGAVTSAAAP